MSEELERELAEVKADYQRACNTLAAMHKAAVGETTGPVLGVVEDVAAVRDEVLLLRSRFLTQLDVYAALGCKWGDDPFAAIARRADLLEFAWGLIANASGGDWQKETAGWIAAAERWRDAWHATLPARPAAMMPPVMPPLDGGRA